MRQEYDRYGLPKFKNLIGFLQILGALGLVIGIQIPWVGQIASIGLAILMLCGVGVRVKIKDTTKQTLPAFVYMVLNAYLAIAIY